MPSAFHAHNTNPLSQYPQAWERAGTVKLLVLDVDGVLTTGQVFIGDNGKETLKAFDIQDGLGIKLLEKVGIATAIITGRTSKMVLARCEELGIKHVHMGVDNKALALEKQLYDQLFDLTAPYLPDLQQLAAQFNIRSIPTLMVFKQGKVVAQQAGAFPKQAFYQWLSQYK